MRRPLTLLLLCSLCPLLLAGCGRTTATVSYEHTAHIGWGRGTTTVSYKNAAYIGCWADLGSEEGVLSAGSSSRLKFTGTSLALSLQVPKRTYPTEISYQVDGGTIRRTTISGGMSLASGLSSGTHTCTIWLEGSYVADNRWVNHDGLAVRGFTVDRGATVHAWPTRRRSWGLVIGDSIAEGNLMLGKPNLPRYGNGRLAFPQLLARSLNCDVWNFSFGGESIVATTGFGNEPPDYLAFGYAMKGVAVRWPSQAPAWVVIESVNCDGAFGRSLFRTDYQALITAIRRKWRRVPIFCLGPMPGIYSAVRDADVSYVARNNTNCHFVETSGWTFRSPYYAHPNVAGHRQIASYLLPMLATYAREASGHNPGGP